MGAGREWGRGRFWVRVGLLTCGFAGVLGEVRAAHAQASVGTSPETLTNTGARAAIVSPSGDPTARSVRVHYQPGDAPGTCVSHRSIRAAVQRALGRPVFFDVEDSDVVVVLDVHSPFGATIELFDREGHSLGTRSLEAKDCAELAQTVAFTMTLMVDFRASEVAHKRALAESAKARAAAETPATLDVAKDAPPKASAPTPAQSTTVAPAKKPQAPKPAATSPKSTTAETVAVPGLGLALDTGLAPQPLLGLYGELAATPVAVWRFVVRVRAERSLQAERALGELGAWRAALTAEACRLREGSDFGFGVCGGLTPGVMWVLVSGYAEDRTTTLLGADAELTLRVRVPLGGGAAASLQFGGGLPLLRNDWHARSAGGDVPLFRAAAVRGVGMLGLVWGP